MKTNESLAPANAGMKARDCPIVAGATWTGVLGSTGTSLWFPIVRERLGASRLPYAALRRSAVLSRPGAVRHRGDYRSDGGWTARLACRGFSSLVSFEYDPGFATKQ